MRNSNNNYWGERCQWMSCLCFVYKLVLGVFFSCSSCVLLVFLWSLISCLPCFWFCKDWFLVCFLWLFLCELSEDLCWCQWMSVLFVLYQWMECCWWLTCFRVVCCCQVSLVCFLTGVHLYDENVHLDQEITSLNTRNNAFDQNSKPFFPSVSSNCFPCKMYIFSVVSVKFVRWVHLLDTFLSVFVWCACLSNVFRLVWCKCNVM